MGWRKEAKELEPKKLPRQGGRMRVTQALVPLLLALVAVLCMAQVTVLYRLWETASEPAPAPVWEYEVISPLDVLLEVDLTTAGRDGWEVASCRRAVNNGSGRYECIMKRLTHAARGAVNTPR